MQPLLLVVALLSFVIYGIAIKKTFSADHGVDIRMHALKIFGTMFAVVHLYAIWTYEPIITVQSVIGLFVYFSALFVFFSAKNALAGHRLTLAFSPDTPSQIVDRGIYSIVRHPFYLAYSLTWLGGVISAPVVLTLATALMMLAYYVYAARLEEEKFLESELSSEYIRYKSRAGMFFPVWRSRVNDGSGSGA